MFFAIYVMKAYYYTWLYHISQRFYVLWLYRLTWKCKRWLRLQMRFISNNPLWITLYCDGSAIFTMTVSFKQRKCITVFIKGKDAEAFVFMYLDNVWLSPQNIATFFIGFCRFPSESVISKNNWNFLLLKYPYCFEMVKCHDFFS